MPAQGADGDLFLPVQFDGADFVHADLTRPEVQYGVLLGRPADDAEAVEIDFLPAGLDVVRQFGFELHDLVLRIVEQKTPGLHIQQHATDVLGRVPRVELLGERVGVNDVVTPLWPHAVGEDDLEGIGASDVLHKVVFALAEVGFALEDDVGFFLKAYRLPPHDGRIRGQRNVDLLGVDRHVVQAVVEGALVGAALRPPQRGDAFGDVHFKVDGRVVEAVAVNQDAYRDAVATDGFALADDEPLRLPPQAVEFVRPRDVERHARFAPLGADGVDGIPPQLEVAGQLDAFPDVVDLHVPVITQELGEFGFALGPAGTNLIGEHTGQDAIVEILGVL